MLNDNRTFEADAYALSSLRLQTRVAKDLQLALDLQAMSSSEEVRANPDNRSFTRETILRLVDWLKEE